MREAKTLVEKVWNGTWCTGPRGSGPSSPRLCSPRLLPAFLPREFWVMASRLKLAMKSLLSDR
jgi:hypothetical protein